MTELQQSPMAQEKVLEWRWHSESNIYTIIGTKGTRKHYKAADVEDKGGIDTFLDAFPDDP